jgi:Rrf2 family iron-sulfur cluster assembly transcriptional regulator
MSVADIIVAVDEPIDATKCGGKESCQDDGQRCMTHELWANLNAQVFAYLRSVSLAQLVAQQQKPDVAVMQDHRAQPAPARAGTPVVVA